MVDTWKYCKLGDVIELLSGYSFRSDGYTEADDEPRLLRGDNIGQGTLRWDNAKRWPSTKLDELERFWLEEGDIVLAMDRPWIEAGMKCAVVTKSDLPCLLVQRVARLRGINGLDTSFLKFAVSTNSFAHYVRSVQTGIAVPHISGKQIKDFAFSLPPLPEQRRIATVLNAIQEAIAAQEDVIAAARAFKRSLMARLFTYGPGRTPAVTKETLYGDVPDHWDSVLLQDCAYVQTGIAKGRKYTVDDDIIEVPYLRVANVQDGYLDLSEIKMIEIKAQELERYRLEAGDVLMTEGGDFDKLGRGFIWNGEVQDCIHQNHVFAVRVNRALCSPEFLTYLAQSSYGLDPRIACMVEI